MATPSKPETAQRPSAGPLGKPKAAPQPTSTPPAGQAGKPAPAPPARQPPPRSPATTDAKASASTAVPPRKPAPRAPVVAAGRLIGARAAAAAVAARPRRMRRRWFVFRTEHGLVAAGLVAAFASGAFGIYMNTRGDVQPYIPGSQYLTVFAQLGHMKRQPAAAPDLSDRFAKAGIDPVVTGSVRQKPAQDTGAGKAVADKTAGPLKGYLIRDVFDGIALVESRFGLSLVKPKSTLAGAGEVLSIEQRGGRWVIVTSGGTITQAN